MARCAAPRGTARPGSTSGSATSSTVGEIHEDLLRWASRSVLMGVVLRTDHPGEKHDEMVVLVGPQGIGKSTAWAWLLPAEPQRALWFSDGLSFHDDQKSEG